MTDHNNYRPHNPVLLAEVISALAPKAGGVYVDATFGGGGYSRAILAAADCQVVGIDRDPDAIAAGQDMVRASGGRLRLCHGRFSQLQAILASQAIASIDGIVFDFGASTAQLTDPARGFSFKHDGPLDMRMEKHGQEMDAAHFINTAAESDLADALWQLGEEKAARRIAGAIAIARTTRPITTTGELAHIVRRAIGKTTAKIDPATRSFQAIRLYINDELGEIRHALPQALSCLRPHGRMLCVSFHSLEDKIVKEFLREVAGTLARPSRHQPLPPATDASKPRLRLITKKPIRPSAIEVAANPRARSARLRVGESIVSKLVATYHTSSQPLGVAL